MQDDLGDRMKLYEGIECGRRFMPLLPVVARVDGRSFHSFTRGMDRPFDERFHATMIDTAIALAKETNACMVYTQSDEITLAWHSTKLESQIWFGGRVAKMTSQLAAQATLHFNRALDIRMPMYLDRLPTFDARVWTVPNRTEGANVFVWREWDATKNSISMAASSLFSDSQLLGRNSADKQDMLVSAGVNWNNYPRHFKRGTYIQRKTVTRPFTAEELELLPPKHNARTNPGLLVERQEFRVLDLPVITTISNREEVIFEGAEPLLHITPS